MILIKVGTEIKQIKSIYYKVGNEVKRLLVKNKVVSEIKDFIKYTIQKLLAYDFAESTLQSMSNTLNFPNLISVDEVTVDNGNVTYTKNQDNVTVSVNNGTVSRSTYDSTKYSMYKEDYRDSSSNSFASSISCSSGGYSGTLYESGSSYVSSGSYTPSDSKTITTTQSGTAYALIYGVGGEGNWENMPPSSISYNSDGYSGTLNLVTYTTSNKRMNADGGAILGDWNATYQGTVTKPGSDTRTYRQKYTGYIYQGGYINYYKYKINIKYTIKN
ncbi:hypothetical protein [Clostridium drakei]|uniref:Uncharacterized protein n=1 Tax=Clostridium drakei TaxID=332101 RepID=A0A2U8DND9_9CLOT|nr:hypothetical protein [Clostridium drakei]AWI04078.1 hypothetical protein B9W14_06080 [Clostridium drakei]